MVRSRTVVARDARDGRIVHNGSVVESISVTRTPVHRGLTCWIPVLYAVWS